MEKILERYFKDDVNELIDKHIGLHEKMLEEEVLSHASAISALTLLKRELNGEVEY